MEKAVAIEPNIENGKRIFEICSLCHSDNGWGMVRGLSQRKPNGYYPQLAGQHKNVLIKQLADIRVGNRDNPVMYPYTLNKYIGGPQDIADVTGYISTLQISPNNEQGPGRHLALGEQIYKNDCKKCHGEYGEGNNVEYYPRVQGQNYSYMLRQMRWIRDGKRRNANAKMVKQIQGFSYRDMKAVIDYISRMPALPKVTTEQVSTN
ncbi:hypothetical protein BOW53_16370 [Solemya pervernicosa gill symbiont]|uniref:Cytochrome c domain-containing protein n=3 Tax=Gammaproteobacteria incertae sedis TaxID=118884 RepID=A0A1T2KZF1_9GAMM|nr:hypothetical protein BOW53_16370 [Solemya pervernicosa gill symbiont]QKQ28234.1 c-type cytochrome [Candidatus Reidiella endopervernicosa]